MNSEKNFIRNIKILLIFLSVGVLLSLLFFYVKYQNEQEEINIRRYFDFNSELLLNIIEEERLNALTVSLMLAQNSKIQQCYINENHQECASILQNYVEILSKIPLYKNILIHMHISDLKSLIRSWNKELYGDDLSDFRYTLTQVKQNLQPISGIEAGRCGVYVRGIAPVFYDNSFVGSIEVMLDFEHLSGFSKKQGYNLFILIDKHYATDCFKDENELLGDFIVLNKKGINYNVLPLLKKLDFKNDKFTKIGSNYFLIQPIYDIRNNPIGHIVMHFNKNNDERIISRLNLILNR